MRSLMVVTPFFVPHVGGMERALSRLVVGLRRRGWDAWVHTSRLTPPSAGGFDVERTGETLGEWAAAVPGRIRSLDPRTKVLFASFGPGTADAQLEAAAEFRSRGGATVWRTPTADHAARNLSKTALDPSKTFSLIVANSELSAGMTGAVVPDVPIRVIPNLLLDHELVECDQYLMSPRTADIAWAGRVEPRKEPQRVAQTLNRLSRAGLDVIAQPVPSYGNSDLLDQFRSSLASGVRVLQPTLGVATEVACASTFLHLATREGSPNSVLEAACRGQALLVSDIPECRQLLANYRLVHWLGNGNEVAPGDVERLRKATAQPAVRSSISEVLRERHREANVVNVWISALEDLVDR